MTGLAAGTTQAGSEGTATAYPRLLRVFTGSIVIAVLCGFIAVATEGSKGLHPAPFLALAALCAISALFAFLLMLTGLLVEAIGFYSRRWRRKN